MIGYAIELLIDRGNNSQEKAPRRRLRNFGAQTAASSTVLSRPDA
jgi:hypothetical protein